MGSLRQRLGLMVILISVLLAACNASPAAQGVAATVPTAAAMIPTPSPPASRRPALPPTPTAAASATPAATAMLPPMAGLIGRFVYHTDRTLWVMNADGSQRIQVTRAGGNDFDPSWSPDGSQFVFRTSRGHYAPDRQGTGTEGIFIAQADGSGERQLYPPNAQTIGGLFPDWSPDGNWIAFSGLRADGSETIYRVHPDGSGLTDLGAPDGSAECAEWSPDATKILVCSQPRNGAWQVWVMDADGGNKVQLTDAPPGRPGGMGGNMGAIWSRDGTQIAFSSDRDGGNNEVYVMNADGSHERRLTNLPGSQSPQVWLPGGRILIDDWSAGKELPDWYVISAADGSIIGSVPALQGSNSPIDWIP
jgi:Tol biopolymer transport system component